MRTRIKICGLTREADVAAAVAAGADAIGFVCYPKSPRYVPPIRLRALGREVGVFATPVLLFVNASSDLVEGALARDALVVGELAVREAQPHARAQRGQRPPFRIGDPSQRGQARLA